MFASMLGFILANVVLFIIFLIILFATLGADKETPISKNSVLMLKLDKPVHERSSNNPFEKFDFTGLGSSEGTGLDDILFCLKKAAKDDRIHGVFLYLSAVPSGMATIEEIRNGIINFKKCGKFVFAYGEYYSQAAYYIATAADRIYLNPQGGIDFKGLRAEIMFFKGALEKLEIEPEVIRHGKFKAAVEPLLLDKMSDENRKQTRAYIGAIWNKILENISKSRNIPVEKLQEIADGLLLRNSNDAVKYGMADELVYRDEILAMLKTKAGLGKTDKNKFVGAAKYSKSLKELKDSKSDNKIAVIYAVGNIQDGNAGDNNIGSQNLTDLIRKERLDDKVKAIVLRVNSPGGSALASDVIWRETILAKQSKPFVVSMGDVAASGGYYISCAADTIVAEPNTITGSIGVFGVLFNTQKLMKNKLGITTDTVLTGKMADLGSLQRPLTAQEKVIIQQSVEMVYDTFITRVANGRHLDKAFVDSIGQGRVWSGTDAKEIGLVDILGGIDTAIAIAAKMAKLPDYRVVEFPLEKDPITKLLEELSGEGKDMIIKQQMGDTYIYYQRLHDLLKMNGIQTRMEFEVELY